MAGFGPGKPAGRPSGGTSPPVPRCRCARKDWWEEDKTIGLPPFPAPGGLYPWADSAQGDMFLWRTEGPTPDHWTVTVAAPSLPIDQARTSAPPKAPDLVTRADPAPSAEDSVLVHGPDRRRVAVGRARQQVDLVTEEHVVDVVPDAVGLLW